MKISQIIRRIKGVGHETFDSSNRVAAIMGSSIGTDSAHRHDAEENSHART